MRYQTNIPEAEANIKDKMGAQKSKLIGAKTK